jgi:hypothetical protein
MAEQYQYQRLKDQQQLPEKFSFLKSNSGSIFSIVIDLLCQFHPGLNNSTKTPRLLAKSSMHAPHQP